MTAPQTAPLAWGRRYLMCPPTHFSVDYAINPWMGGVVDTELAQTQWEGLVAALRMAGAEVEFIEAAPGLPDMVFTANAGVVDGSTFLVGELLHPERTPESLHTVRWAGEHGYAVRRLPAGEVLEGLGDCMPLGDVMVAGYGMRSTTGAHREVADETGRRVIGVRLDDPRWYHVDLTLCPLDDRRAIVYPEAYDAAGAAAVLAEIPEPLILDGDEAATFAANSVVVDRTVIMPSCPPRVGRQLEAWGFAVSVVDVGEFLKAGGAVRCLTLPLDTALSPVLVGAVDARAEVVA